MARPAKTYNENLSSKFVAGDAGACWIWAGFKPQRHYPVFVYKQDGVCKSKGAHRAVYEMLVGEIADGLVLDHLCKNIHCVNPSHLEPVTQADNLRRSENHIGINMRKTHCIHGHEFTQENTYIPPSKPSSRYCKACANIRSKRLEESK